MATAVSERIRNRSLSGKSACTALGAARSLRTGPPSANSRQRHRPPVPPQNHSGGTSVGLCHGDQAGRDSCRVEEAAGRSTRESFPSSGVEQLRVHPAARRSNRVEQSHLPTRLRERQMQGFRSIDSAQQFLSLYSRVCNLFRPRRYLLTAAEYRSTMRSGFVLGAIPRASCARKRRDRFARPLSGCDLLLHQPS